MEYAIRGLFCVMILWLDWSVPHAGWAIVINDDFFESSGGDVTDVFGTVDQGYADARAYSYADPFLSVGNWGHCTGTWIGNDARGTQSFFLTAAHCFESDPPTPTRTVSATFSDWNGNVAASGAGTFYLPPQRVNVPPGFGGASTDIGIVVYPGQVIIQDAAGQDVPPPLIYDGVAELGWENSFVGYGSWGIGSQGSDGGLFPSSGPRRAGATNVISSIYEQDHGLGTSFTVPGADGATPLESAVAAGDSGSAWWQEHLGRWTIIGTTNGGSGTTYGTGSTAARVSQYAAWIQSVYPEVRLWTDVRTDINQDGVVSGNGHGPIAEDDFSAFIAGWRLPNTPDSPQPADLDEDGIVALSDFGILRQAILAAGGEDLDLNLLVPEPNGLSIAVLMLLSLVWVNMKSRTSP